MKIKRRIIPSALVAIIVSTFAPIFIQPAIAKNNSPSVGVCIEHYSQKNYVKAMDECSLFQGRIIASAKPLFIVGEMYNFGLGVDKDYKAAFKWYSESVEAGSTNAKVRLTRAYRFGIGTKKDMSKAVHWMKKAAEEGVASAQSDLGTLYYHGEDVKKDYQKMIHWYFKAAEQGYAEAQFNLAGMYDQGIGVPIDFVRSYAWFNVAAAQGFKPASKARDYVASKLSVEQQGKGQSLSSEYYDKYVKK